MIKEKLSPIPECDNYAECRSIDSEFDESVDLLENQNKVTMSKDTVQCNSGSNSDYVQKGQVHLNIKDISNDTSDDSVLNTAQLVTNIPNKEIVVKSVGDGNDCGWNDKFGSGLDVSAETDDLNDSIDYKSIDEEIAKTNKQKKTEISATEIPEKDDSTTADESTITASKITDTDDEKSVTIPASSSTDGSTLVEKTQSPLPQFFPDSDEISTGINSNTSGEKNEGEEITENGIKEVMDGKKEEITDKTNTEPTTVPKDVMTENNMKDGSGEIELEGETLSQNYDLSVRSTTIDPNKFEDSEDNDEGLSISEIPTSQLDTTLPNSSDEDNENVDEISDGKSTVNQKKEKEDTGGDLGKKKRLGTTGPVKNVKSKKPKNSPKKKVNDKNKKGGKEEIGEEKKSSKLEKQKSELKEGTDEDSTLTNDRQRNIQTEQPTKSK